MKKKKIKKKEVRKEKPKKVEKEEKGKEEKVKEEKAKSKKYASQTKIAIIIMVVLLLSVLLTYWLVQRSKTFDYHGIKFYKVKEDSLVFYKTSPLTGYVPGGKFLFLIKLRNDPRELEKIRVEGNIKLIREEVVLSLSPVIAECPSTFRTVLDFSMTLKGFRKNVMAASTDEEYAEAHDTPLVTCGDTEQRTVIVMREGDKTEIFQDSENSNCYVMEIKDCETQESFERFILQFLENVQVSA